MIKKVNIEKPNQNSALENQQFESDYKVHIDRNGYISRELYAALYFRPSNCQVIRCCKFGKSDRLCTNPDRIK